MSLRQFFSDFKHFFLFLAIMAWTMVLGPVFFVWLLASYLLLFWIILAVLLVSFWMIARRLLRR